MKIADEEKWKAEVKCEFIEIWKCFKYNAKSKKCDRLGTILVINEVLTDCMLRKDERIFVSLCFLILYCWRINFFVCAYIELRQ